MKFHERKRLYLVAAVLGAVAVFTAAFFVALAVRSVVADPGASAPNPGHEWSEVEGHGIDGGDYWLGTTVDQALELRVNNARALRLEPTTDSPNLIGGYSGNSVSGGVYGATIGGGGSPDDGTGNPAPNQVTAPYGTVGGGANNTASGDHATVGGGLVATASGNNATVAGGLFATASGDEATVSGGYNNGSFGHAGTVGGGGCNSAGGDYATIGGGYLNVANGYAATVAGGGRTDPGDLTTGNRVTDDYGTIGGGGNNQAGNGGPDSTDAPYTVVSGGQDNTASGYAATVAGGEHNQAGADMATVGGGDTNSATSPNATVGGGILNIADDNSTTVGGGRENTASNNDATVGGGFNNTASGLAATVAVGDYAAVAGGGDNMAAGFLATVGGGHDNTAQGDYSFAAGRHGKANNQGCFVWGDSTDADVACDTNDRFVVRASGGVYLYTNSGLTSGCWLAAGSNSWSCFSDRSLKENLVAADGDEILERLSGVPVFTWNAKGQDAAVRHIGPMAQDFYAAFGVGEDDGQLATIDLDGVALAAIQGLYELSQEQDARIQALEARVAALEGDAGVSGGSAGALSSVMPFGPLLLGGLVLGGLVLVQRRRAGGRS